MQGAEARKTLRERNMKTFEQLIAERAQKSDGSEGAVKPKIAIAVSVEIKTAFGAECRRLGLTEQDAALYAIQRQLETMRAMETPPGVVARPPRAPRGSKKAAREQSQGEQSGEQNGSANKGNGKRKAS